MARRTTQARVRERQRARGAVNAPRLTFENDTPAGGILDGPLPPVEAIDWPAIEPLHPLWWQVRRVETQAGRERSVLIAECPNELAAVRVALVQRSQAVVVRYRDNRETFRTYRAPRVVD